MLTDPEPRNLALTGSDHAPINHLDWHGVLDKRWSQTQTCGLSSGSQGAVLAAAGATLVSQTSEVCGPTDVDNRWDYPLALADAVPAVPERAPVWLWLTGLGLLSSRPWRRGS
jgi:hypothetical protein